MDGLFLLLVGWQFVLLTVAPTGQNGDGSEYAHRPFPLLYVIAVVLLSGHAASALRLRFAVPPMRGATFTAAAASIALVSTIPAVMTAYDPALGRMSWVATAYRPVVDRGVVALASDLKGRSASNEVIAVGPIDPDSRLVDNGVIIASLANRAVYLTTPAIQLMLGGKRGEEAKRRLQSQNNAEKRLILGKAEAAGYVSNFAWYVDTKGVVDSRMGAVFANSFGRTFRIKP
jgi:hypothetical protein